MRIGIDISKGLTPRDGIGVYTAELVRAFMRRDDEDEKAGQQRHDEHLQTQGALSLSRRLRAGAAEHM